MPELRVEKSRTALLIMDYQNDIVSGNQMMAEHHTLENTQKALAAAREAKLAVVYVVVRFRPGHPEVSANNRGFSAIKERKWLVEGTPGAEIPQALSPLPGEVVVTKHRVNAFYQTDLDMVLRAKGVDTLVLAGIATGGVVAATATYAADADYQLVILDDCCADRDVERHNFLLQEYLAGRATIASAQDFIAALK